MAKKKKRVESRRLEILLVDLHEIVKTSNEDRGKASSLVDWYITNQYWTPKQFQFVKALIKKHKTRKEAPQKKLKKSKYHLYAISDGEAVK